MTEFVVSILHAFTILNNVYLKLGPFLKFPRKQKNNVDNIMF